MEQNRGILFLADPLREKAAPQTQMKYANLMTLVFDENERYLSLAQAALWRIRQKSEWVCVAAEGKAACIALALAAQLPVDRLALADSDVFSGRRRGVPREIARLEAYARRNFSLVVSEILLIGAREAEARRMLHAWNRDKVCVVAGDALDWKKQWTLLTAPWDVLSQKNLLIPRNCV